MHKLGSFIIYTHFLRFLLNNITNNIEMQGAESINERVDWIEEAIAKKDIKYSMILTILIILKKLAPEHLEKFIVLIGKIQPTV
jgi:hypothetical protein